MVSNFPPYNPNDVDSSLFSILDGLRKNPNKKAAFYILLNYAICFIVTECPLNPVHHVFFNKLKTIHHR